MNKLKFVLFVLLLMVTTLIPGYSASAATPVNAYLFWGDGCPHCEKELNFFKNHLLEKYNDLHLYDFEIYYDRDNALLLQKVAETYNIQRVGVPLLIIGNYPFVGYDEKQTPTQIENKIKECMVNTCPDPLAELLDITPTEPDNEPAAELSDENQNSQPVKNIKLPWGGEVNVYSFSLPALTVILGLLDGFNPCAMWTLLFLISLLLGMSNRKKMWILGTTFIAASAAVYYLFMAAWLNLFLFLGWLIWIRIAIGFIAILAGIYSIREFIINKDASCKIGDLEQKQKTREKIKQALQQNKLWLAIVSIVVLAVAVNLIELLCSAGLPAIYTQVLTLSQLLTSQYYLYLLLYIFFFMLDDMFIFVLAMITLQTTGMTTKYTKASRLIGGLLMLLIGLLLLFRPDWLKF
ncbi:MAG: hypothetical protein ABIJ81_01740 [Patescibacteria group bacterium]